MEVEMRIDWPIVAVIVVVLLVVGVAFWLTKHPKEDAAPSPNQNIAEASADYRTLSRWQV